MNRRLLLLSACLALAASWALSVPAGAAGHDKIGPHQYFDGLVNGSIGVGHPAIVKVVCPGPASRTGHPLAGQTVEVTEPKVVLSTSGYTGNKATSIDVFFGAPPPAAEGPGPVNFTKYGVAKSIPTSLDLPCSGTGHVTFVPFPQSPPTSRAATVAVQYVNVAA
ncbi:MAG: hypothetical protein ABSF33_20095 [Acidimicrobiales bacterium]|jgi:hypothetical protein